MTSVFNTSREYPRMQVWRKFGDYSTNLWQVITCTNLIPRILSQNGQNDLEGQGKLSPIPTKSIPWCMFGANVWRVLLWTRLSSRMNGRTDGQTQATTIPLRPERSNVKMKNLAKYYSILKSNLIDTKNISFWRSTLIICCAFGTTVLCVMSRYSGSCYNETRFISLFGYV